jgi:glc operon protein GlcG
VAELENQMIRKILIACAAMIAIPAAAQPPTPPASGYGPPIGVSEALALIDRGMEKSTAHGLKMVFAVVEPSGELVAFARMDDAPYASIRLAQQKASTSARLRLTTAELEERVQGGRMALLSSDEVIAIGGGVPIVVNGKIIGALGVSGGTAAQDAAVAEEALAPR